MRPAEGIRPFGPTKVENGAIRLLRLADLFSGNLSRKKKILLERDTADEARLREAQWELLYWHRYYGSVHVRVTA